MQHRFLTGDDESVKDYPCRMCQIESDRCRGNCKDYIDWVTEKRDCREGLSAHEKQQIHSAESDLPSDALDD